MVEGGFPFPMLSDQGGQIGSVYGIYDAAAGVDIRGRFIIDPDGVIQAMEVLTPTVGRNIQETIRQVQAFQHVRETGEVMPSGWQPGKATLTPGPELVPRQAQGICRIHRPSGAQTGEEVAGASDHCHRCEEGGQGRKSDARCPSGADGSAVLADLLRRQVVLGDAADGGCDVGHGVGEAGDPTVRQTGVEVLLLDDDAPSLEARGQHHGARDVAARADDHPGLEAAQDALALRVVASTEQVQVVQQVVKLVQRQAVRMPRRQRQRPRR